MATFATYYPSPQSFDIDVYALEATYCYTPPPPPPPPVAAPPSPPPHLSLPVRSALPPALRILPPADDGPIPRIVTAPPPELQCGLSRSYARRASSARSQYVAWKPLRIVRKDTDDWKDEIEYTDEYEEVKMAMGAEDWAREYQELIGEPWTPV